MNEAKLLFLGTTSGMPTPNAWFPSFLLTFQGYNVLVDAGEGVQLRLIENSIGPSRIDMILISHLHGDHIFGLPGLIQSMNMTSRTKELHIIAPTELREFLDLIFEKTRFSPDFPITFSQPLQEKTVEKGNIRIKVHGFRVCHNEIDSYGYVIEGYKLKKDEEKRVFRVSYTGDTKPCENYFKYIVNSDILIHDATFEEKMREEAHLYGHSTSIDAAEVALKSNAKLLILFHKSTRYKRDSDKLLQQARRIFHNTILAEDNMVVPIL